MTTNPIRFMRACFVKLDEQNSLIGRKNMIRATKNQKTQLSMLIFLFFFFTKKKSMLIFYTVRYPGSHYATILIINKYESLTHVDKHDLA